MIGREWSVSGPSEHGPPRCFAVNGGHAFPLVTGALGVASEVGPAGGTELRHLIRVAPSG
jgi:hypothetical protein